MSIVGKEKARIAHASSKNGSNVVSFDRSTDDLVLSTLNCGKAGRGVASLSKFELSAISHCARLSKNPDFYRPTILDVGTGAGVLAQQLVNAGARVVAVDRENNLSSAARELCEERRIKFVSKPIEDLARRDLPREVNAVTAMRVLHWLRNPDAEDFLKMAASAMPTGSQLFFSVAMLRGAMGVGYPLTEKTPISSRYASIEGNDQQFSHPVTLYSLAEAAKLAERAGFNISRIHPTGWGMCNIRASRTEKNHKYFAGADMPAGVS